MSLRCDNCGTTSIGDFEECPHCGQETSLKDVREQLAEAQAQAAAWEEIATALATPSLWVYETRDSSKNNPQFCADSFSHMGYGPTRAAALLAWHAEQKKKKTEARSHRGISNGGDTCTDSYCWCNAGPLKREY